MGRYAWGGGERQTAEQLTGQTTFTPLIRLAVIHIYLYQVGAQSCWVLVTCSGGWEGGEGGGRRGNRVEHPH